MTTPRTIFVIDDDGDFVSLLTEILTQAGYQVQSTTKPAEALERFKTEKFDLLVVDQRMGQMTGSELLKKVRETDKQTPVIVISGFLEHSSAQQFINLGVSGIFFKPLNIFALLKRVEELFKGLVKSTGVAKSEVGVPGFTRAPFGSNSSREVFLKKLQTLSSFKGNLILVGDAESPFEAAVDEIIKNTPKDQRINWESGFTDIQALSTALKGLTTATLVFRKTEKLSTAEQKILYRLAKPEAGSPEEKLPPVRFIFCMEEELDALYERQAIGDEFYLFLGNLELKLPRPVAARKHTVPGLIESARTGGRILVLDDEDIHAQMLVDVLEGAGFKTLKINSPMEAIIAMRKERFSLIVTDFRMPGINGVDFVSQARQIEPSMPIFIVTGNIQLPEVIRIGNMGVTQVIQKPIDIKVFVEEVQKVVVS